MSTVVSSVPTAEGFVIGSDGRNSRSDPREVISDDAQKIFSIDRRGMKLAYGLSGTIRIGDHASNVTVNLEAEILRAIEKIGRRTNWPSYLNALATALEQSINKARLASKQTLAAPLSTTISIGGFFEKSQELGHIRFEHGIQHTEADPQSYPPGFCFPGVGSLKVFELLDSGDSRFAQYIDPPRFGLKTLQAGIKRVRNDILAHYDAEAHKLDEENCWAIGGRVQIATVTRSDGLRWVPGFEPVALET
jgi:hypothetical protein